VAKFLRDGYLKNITITEKTLTLIDEYLSELENAHNETLRELDPDAPETIDKTLVMTYVIRFDNRGYQLNDFSEVKRHFVQAINVERVIFQLDSGLSARTNATRGDLCKVHLDSRTPNNCFISVTSELSHVVDSVFHGLNDIIDKCRNRHGFARNTWFQLALQIFGVIVGFGASLIAGVEIAPHLNIDNSIVISFLFAFLVFSNLWGFIYAQFLRLFDHLFPSIHFLRKEKDRFHWLAQTVIGGLIVAVVIFFLGHAFVWAGKILGQFVKNG